MKLLIRQAKLVIPHSPLNGTSKDILIDNGKIIAIDDNIVEQVDKVIESDNLHASVGWIDIFADFCDPGYEHRETLESGAAAAAAGGFTSVAVIPNTNPVVHNKSAVEYLVQKSKTLPVNILSIGAISKNTEGKELAEMYDMRASGAVVFSDGKNGIQSAGILLKALQYVAAFKGTIIQLPDDKSISPHGLMNEGIISTQLGLPGKPSIAEEIMVSRDIEIARYSNAHLHITAVSTQKSIALIEKAKQEGVKISCSVTPYHLFFCDEDLTGYDTNLKVNPPLRSRVNMLALREAVGKGIVDCIASHHIPQDYDNKVCEFEYAKYGMIGLETVFNVAMTTGIDYTQFVEMQTINARNIVGLDIPEIKEGAFANITLFDPTATTSYAEKNIHSKSKNSAFTNKSLQGKVIGIVNGNKIALN